jgi:alkylation response protein AidB-like acyl-CoA dehydrogenase
MTAQDVPASYELSQEQRILRGSVVDFLGKECPLETVKELMSSGQPYSPELWAKMVEQEYLGLLVPEAIGGLSLGPLELVIISEEMGKVCLPGPFIPNLWGSCALERSAPGKQREAVLTKILKGEMILTVAFTEPEGGRLPSPGALKAEGNDSGYLITGEIYVMDGEHADQMLFAAKVPDGQSILAMVPLDTPGLRISQMPGLDHMRPCFRVSCAGVPVAEDQLFAVGDNAESAMAYATLVGALAASAEMIGSMQGILQTTLASARKRDQMGQAIEVFRDIPPRCSDMLAAVDKCRSILYGAAISLDNVEADVEDAVTHARACCAEAAGSLGSLLLQCQEGMDLTWEQDVHMFRSIPPFFSSIC